jgi:ATP-dependent RNA helicase DeaD
LVLDEADEMLNMGFAEDVETILAETPQDKQVALFSATMPKQIRRLSQQYLNDPVEITVKNTTATTPNITQRYLIVGYPQKIDALTRIFEVENFEGMIVFVRTKHETESLAEKLRARGFSATAINGDVAQAQRERTVSQLKSGALDILVATDVAARGLDVERISHVVNFDIPTDPESYVHRIGRTGRAGRSGQAISFVTPRERYLLRHIEKATRQPLTEMHLPSVEDVNQTRLARFDDAITSALSETAKVEFFRDVLAHYIREHDVPEPVRPPRRERPERGDRPDRGDRPPRDRGERGARAPQRNWDNGVPLVPYRINVGKRHRVEPRQIVGAIANEGGLVHADFGKIQIRPDFSIVELPADLPPAVWDALAKTRISGKLIELRRDEGPRSPGPSRGQGWEQKRPKRDRDF